MGWLSSLSERFRPRPTAVPEHRAALAAAEEEWLRLEMLREELEG